MWTHNTMLWHMLFAEFQSVSKHRSISEWNVSWESSSFQIFCATYITALCGFQTNVQVCSWPQSCGLYQAPWLMGVVQFPLMWRKCKIKWGNEGTKWITFEHGSPNCETFSWIITSKLLFNYNLIIDWEVDNQQGRKSGPNPLVHRLKAHWQSNFHQNVFVKSWVQT